MVLGIRTARPPNYSCTQTIPSSYLRALADLLLRRPTVAEVSFITPFLHILLKLGPAWFRRLLVRLVPLQAVQRFREVVDVMDTTANRIFREKKESVSKMLSDGKAGKAELEELKDVMSLTREFFVCFLPFAHHIDTISSQVVSNMQNTRLTDEELVAQMRSDLLSLLPRAFINPSHHF